MKKVISTFLLASLVSLLYSQTNQNPWLDAPESSFANKNTVRRIVPSKYRTLSLDLDLLKATLEGAPLRFTPAAEIAQATLTIPMPDGTMQEFQVVEAPVMHPELAQRYPYIRSFAGWSTTDRTAYLRCGYTQQGFHAVIFSANHSTVYLDAFAEGDLRHYISYFKKDYPNPHDFTCLVNEQGPTSQPLVLPGGEPLSISPGDCQHRSYALALACTGEYAAFHGGTKPLVMAAFNIAITRINGIYERELAVTLTMVANTDLLIYLNAGSDPYTNNDGGTMLNENQTTCNNIIGNANYDIGHVFSTGGGGVAQLNSVCSTSGKARGVTGLGSPIGDPFYVDYVAHEMGHQFGGNHTQNNSCNRNGATAMEVGSGTTIMGYAGVCSPNVELHSDDYFHAVNLVEMHAHLAGSGNTCATTTATGNSAPNVSVTTTTYNVPKSTPFVLTAQGTDSNPTDVLTYCWEQMNNDVGTQPPLSTNTVGPVFRTFNPSTSPNRYFPNMNAILSGTTPTWEVLPSVARSMAFRCTVRDNHPGAGCTDEVNVSLNFSAGAGPFLVTNPNTSSVVWTGGSIATVAWNVANTNLPPIATSQVEVLLSADGGLTYPYTLLATTNNDGTESVLVPNIATTQARVMVKAKGNIYFDISNQNFKIELAVDPSFLLQATPSTTAACQSGGASYEFNMLQLAGFNTPVNFTASGVPAGATASFTPNNVPPPANVQLAIGNLVGVPAGTYDITVTAVGGIITQTTIVQLVVLDQVSGTTTPLTPASGADVTDFQPTLTWQAVANASGYTVEVSESPSFSTLFATGIATSTAWEVSVPCTSLGVYYWRVRATNPCSQSDFSQTFAFHLGGIGCQTFNATGLPLNIPLVASSVTKTLNVPIGVSISSVNTSINIDHSYVGDLSAELISPQGTTLQIFDRPGVPASSFGCAGDDITANFGDAHTNTATAFENACAGGTPTISGNYQPIAPFAGFSSENSQGSWSLKITDSYDDDGGGLLNWSLDICGLVASSPAVLIKNEVLSVPQAQGEVVSQAYLQGQGNPANQVVFTLLSLPTNGNLILGIDVPVVGSTFTQADIDAGLFSYQHDGSMTTSDEFAFDLLDHAGNWLPAQVFQINIIPNNLAATAAITQTMSCAGANNGEITVTASGGNAPLEYSINGGTYQSSNVFTNLAAGSYTVQVKDAIGFLITTASVTISSPAQVTASASVNNDQIMVTGGGGTGSLTYSIGAGFQGNNVFNGAANGVYTVTVMDSNGCTATTSAIVAVNSIVVNASITANVLCFGVNDGQITVTVGGGLAPFQYSLNGGNFQNSNVFSNLAPGSYSVEVMDADGFTQTSANLTLNSPTQLTGSASANGYTISATASGGTGSLQYSLDGGSFQSGNTFTPIANGSHTVTVRDANGCQITLNVTVTVPLLSVSGLVSQAISCFGQTGAISASGLGGVPAYQYSLNGGAYQPGSVFSNLAAGSYTLTIKDSGGFTVSSMAIALTAPPALVVAASATSTTVAVVANGGTPAYQYQLDNGTLQGTGVFSNVALGSHTVTVSDANGCTQTTTVLVTGTPPNIFASLAQPVSCHGGADAVISVSASGGIAPYIFSLNGGLFQSTSSFPNLAAGTYSVAVMGADGGITTAPDLLIIDPPTLGLTASAFGFTITATANGGSPGYQFSLDGVTFNPDNELTAGANGSYTVTVQDEHGCTATTNVNVNAVTGAAITVANVSCFGEADGAVTIGAVTGGTAPYTFSLNGGAFSSQSTYTNLAPGEYTIWVKDASGYEFEINSIIVAEPYELEMNFQLVQNHLTILAGGGTGQLMYSIDGGVTFQTSNTFNDLALGIYQVVVMDENGCTFEGQVIVDMSAMGEQVGVFNFEVLPNPSDGLFILKMDLPSFAKLHLLVFDVVGRQVFASQMEVVGAVHQPLDLRGLASGTYLLRVSDGEVWGMKKLVVLGQ